jgi:hypothetical protein
MKRTRTGSKRAKTKDEEACEKEMSDMSYKVLDWIEKEMHGDYDDFLAEGSLYTLLGDCKPGTIQTEFLRKHWRVLFTDDPLPQEASQKLHNCSFSAIGLGTAFWEAGVAIKKARACARELAKLLQEPE